MTVIGAPLAKIPHNPPGSALYTGSWRSEWIVAYDDATTTITPVAEAALFIIDTPEFHWTPVPEGATLIRARARTTTAASTFTTQPVVEIWGLTQGGVPHRLDQSDQDSATQVTLNLDSSATTGVVIDGTGVVSGEDGNRYGDIAAPSGLAGWDLQGVSYVGLLPLTAADVKDSGSAPLPVPLLIQFLNG